MKKLLAVAVILLFFGVAFAPSINAVDRNKSRIFRDIPQGKMLRIPVLECKADGTRKTKMVSISRESAKELREKIIQVNTPEEKFLLFQQYGLIPEDLTLEQLRAEMYRFAERYDITLDKLLGLKERLERIPLIGPPRAVNFLSFNVGEGYFGLHLLLGLSFFTGVLNSILFNPWEDWYFNPPSFAIPSVDLFDIFLGLLEGKIESESNFSYFRTRGGSLVYLLGFVGFVFSVPLLIKVWGFVGFSVAIVVRCWNIEYIPT